MSRILNRRKRGAKRINRSYLAWLNARKNLKKAGIQPLKSIEWSAKRRFGPRLTAPE